MIKQVLNILVLIFFLLVLSSSDSLSQSQTKISSELDKAKYTNQEIIDYKQKLESLEKRYSSNQLEIIKQVLTVSGDTVKYVGIVAAIILPLIIFLIGYQVIRAYQFENEFRETKKLLTDEYQKAVALRSESEKFLGEMKSKVSNLENIVVDLATDFLRKRTSGLVAEVKERTEQIFAEIKTKQDLEIEKSIELMRKLETLDLTLTPSIYVERGTIYLGQKNWDKAIENFTKAIEQKRDSFDAYFQRGLAYQSTKNLDEALNDYEKATKINPRQPATYANIGVCYREKVTMIWHYKI